jgi:hypothetical protein
VDACALTTDSLSELKERAVRNNDPHRAFFLRITKGAAPMLSRTLAVRIAVFLGVHVGMLVGLLAFLLVR